MKVKINTPQELGLLMRATRKSQGIRIEDVAGSAQVGPVFVREAERGKETVSLVRVMRLLHELGINLQADVPDTVAANLAKLQQTGVKPLPKRSTSKNALKNRISLNAKST